MLHGLRRLTDSFVRWVAHGLLEPERRDAPARLRFVVHIVAMLVLAIVVAAGAGLLLWWALGEPALSADRPGPLSPSDVYDGIKIALAVVAGIGGVIALVVAYRRQRFAEREHRRAEATVVREDTKLFTERFAKASEQLGSDKAAVRLAGVYAMASLADHRAADRQTCINVLCAYLRMPYVPPVEPDTDGAEAGEQEVNESVSPAEQRARLEERQVRHTIMQVIGTRLRNDGTASWQGCDFDLTGGTFDGGDFSGAKLSGGRVDFSRARFVSGLLDFSNATLSGGKLDFSDATFSGGQAYFARAKFTGGEVDFVLATLSGGRVDFAGAVFSGSHAHFNGAVFSSAEVSFGAARFSDGLVDFSGVSFSGGSVDFGLAMFAGGCVDFGDGIFSAGQVDFSLAMFSGSPVNFTLASFRGGEVSFREAKFAAGIVDFKNAQFSAGCVDFRRATYAGGVVDLASPRAWEVPPVLDAWTEGPPTGLLLPNAPATHPAETRTASDAAASP